METKDISIRPITDDDQAFLRTVYGSIRQFEQELAGWNDDEWNSFMDMQFSAQHKYYEEHYSDCDFSIILYKQKSVGRLYVQKMKEEIRVVDIAILPEYRNKGLGTFLLKSILEEAQKSDKYVRLHIEGYNPAIRLYKRLGFYGVEDRGVYLFYEWKSSNMKVSQITP